jgi:hypothetical protein
MIRCRETTTYPLNSYRLPQGGTPPPARLCHSALWGPVFWIHRFRRFGERVFGFIDVGNVGDDECFGTALRAIVRCFADSWAAVGVVLQHFAACWGDCGGFLGLPQPSWAILEGVLGPAGRVLGRLAAMRNLTWKTHVFKIEKGRASPTFLGRVLGSQNRPKRDPKRFQVEDEF